MKDLNHNSRINLLPKNGEAYFFPGLFNSREADRYFYALQDEVEWKQEPIILFGKPVMQPRLTAWYGDPGKDYSYSGIHMVAKPWSKNLLAIKKKAETVAGIVFNSALLNYYRDGRDSMGWHRDNEKELGTNPVIGSVSFGAARRFLFRHYQDKTLRRSIELEHGSFLLMRGDTQHSWQHSIPKTAKPTGPRINITFRVILG